jgi:CPA2 family monovalent cation:H+ antiporter-2
MIAVTQATRLLELGGVLIGLAVLARVAGRIGIPAIPLYLGAGLAFGRGGILPLVTTHEFVGTGARRVREEPLSAGRTFPSAIFGPAG